jgi:nicotinate-nucleotide adenylyltransferase
MALCALEQHRLEKVIFMPSGTPPHKKDDLLDKELRFELLDAEIKAANDPRLESSRLEIDRPGVTWTIDTLDELRKLYGPDVRFNFIIGEDNINSIARYDRRTDLLSRCRLLVAPRGNSDLSQLAQWKRSLPEAAEDGIAAIECPANALSSTLVRNYIHNGRSVRYMVPASILALIERKGLYKSAPATPPAPAAAGTAPAVSDQAAAPATQS